MMNPHDMANLINTKVYYAEIKFKTSMTLYTYKVPLTIGELKEGDKVIVPSNSSDEFSIVTVVKVHKDITTVNLEARKKGKFKYIIDKVDFTHLSKAEALDREIVNLIEKKQQETIIEQMRKIVNEEFPQLLELVNSGKLLESVEIKVPETVEIVSPVPYPKPQKPKSYSDIYGDIDE